MLAAVWKMVISGAVESEVGGQDCLKAASTEAASEISTFMKSTPFASEIMSGREGGRISRIRIFRGSSPRCNK